MLFRTLSASFFSTLDNSTDSWKDWTGAVSKKTEKMQPANRLGFVNFLKILGRGIGIIALIALAVALILSGLAPVLFIGLALFLPALAPFFLIGIAVFGGRQALGPTDCAANR